jgi:isoaspartyl peptidase/L-asparaginase-like protein (Ntn-hydrolase superfamily)
MTTLLASWREPGKVTIDAAWQARSNGADLLTAMEHGLAAAEYDPTLMAIGLGSLPNADGELELDAAIMDGKDLNAGAVCAVRGIVPAISIARKVMDKTPHVMLAGDQARRFAIEHGFKPTNLMTEANIASYAENFEEAGKLDREYVHSSGEHYGDTVTILGWEDGHVASASSTSGLSWKIPGRVGDSPIIGAGVYADDEVGCAGATGWGEELWKAVASFRAAEWMRNGKSPQEACDIVVDQMMRRQPNSHVMACVVIAMNNRGEFGAANTKGDFPLWVCTDGKMELKVYKGVLT